MGCEDLVRIVFIILMVVFILLGGGIFGIVQWLRADSESLVALFNGLPADLGASRTFLSSIYGLGFAIGMMTFTNSWVGFAGAAGKNRGFLYWFSGILSALIIIELAGVILAGIFSGKIQDFLTKESKPLFEQYNATFTPTGTANTYAYKSWDKTTSAMDSLQTRFECCGINGYQDYYNNTAVFPVSCCSQTITDSRSDLANNIFKQAENTVISVADPTCPYDPNGSVTLIIGCYDKLEKTVKTKAILVLSLLATAFGFQIAMIVMAVYMARKFPVPTGGNWNCCGQRTDCGSDKKGHTEMA